MAEGRYRKTVAEFPLPRLAKPTRCLTLAPMRASVSLLLLTLLTASAAADPCPPPSRWMLDVVRHASRVRLVRLAGRERDKNPLARDTTFLGYRALGGADLRPPAAKLAAAALGRPMSYACGDLLPDTIFAGPLALGFDFEAPSGRLRLVLLEPERTLELHLDTGAYTESKLSDRGLRAWHAALGQILRQRGETRADFERRMSPPPPPPPPPPTHADSVASLARAADSTKALDLVELRKAQLLAVTRVQPVYPDMAREAGVDGTVLVSALVDPNGNVHDAKVVKSIPMLDAAAIAAVRPWRFNPYLDQGTAVWAWTRVPVRFSLH